MHRERRAAARRIAYAHRSAVQMCRLRLHQGWPWHSDACTAGSSARASRGETTQDDLPNPDLRDTIDAVDGTTLLLAPVRVTAQGED